MAEAPSSALVAEVDQYLAEADALKYGDPQQLLSAAQKAAARAQVTGDFRRYSVALTHEAWAYGNLGRYELSLTYALEVLALAREYGLVEIEARIVGIIGLNFYRCGIRQDAIYLYEHQRTLGEELQNDEIQALALNDLGTVKLEAQDNDIAMALFERAVTLMPPDTHHGLDRSITHLNLSIAYVNARRYDEAVEQAQEVLARVQTDAPRLVSDANLVLAEVAMGRGELAEAHRFLARARACIENASPPLYSDNVEQCAAELLTYEGRHQEAAQVWERMYTMALQQQELEFAVSALNHVKDAYERINDSAGLISAYKRLAEDIPRLQKQGSDLRITVLRTVFAMDKAALQADLHLTRRKNAILERLSHEFRTPLAIIQSSAQIIDQYGDRMTLEQRQERLRRITDQVQWMTVMLEDILELLTLDDRQAVSVAQTSFQLEELARGAVLELARYEMTGSRIRIQAPPEVEHVVGPQKLLRLVLVHLLTNALKFSQSEVALNLSIEEETLVMRVVDQGIGIPKQDLEIILKPLARGSNLDEVKGTGLGLAIVSKLVEQMNGTIDLESVEMRGTTVTVRVPLAAVAYAE